MSLNLGRRFCFYASYVVRNLPKVYFLIQVALLLVLIRLYKISTAEETMTSVVYAKEREKPALQN
jgi:hypothetical protein